MDTQEQSGRATGQSRASSRPFIGATVQYTSQGGDALVRGRVYAATITAIDQDLVSLHVIAPNAKFDLAGVHFSPTTDPGCWTWPAAN